MEKKELQEYIQEQSKLALGIINDKSKNEMVFEAVMNDIYSREIDEYAWFYKKALEYFEKDTEAAECFLEMAKSNERTIKSCLEILLDHLIKWTCQPSQQSKSWYSSIFDSRSTIDRELSDSPGLKKFIKNVDIEHIYQRAIPRAICEMQLYGYYFDHPSKACPWEIEQLLDFDWLNEFIQQHKRV